MKYYHPTDFIPEKAWDALDIANLDGTTVRLHWTDQPYIWHVNDGQEVFVVLDGEVDMHVKDQAGIITITKMTQGMIAHADIGVEHVAHPTKPSRILVIEKEGSI